MMIRGQKTEDGGQRFCRGFAAQSNRRCRVAAHHPLSSVFCPLSSERGFTLVEMIVVIVITGIIGGIVAIFIKAPIQGYVDSARRAEMTDIADTALRRISRDLRLALPNSVRVTTNGANFYLELFPTTGGGRYCNGAPCNELSFNNAADTSFDVLGPTVTANPNNFLVIYNLGIASSSVACASPGADAYEGCNRRTIPSSSVGNTITFTPTPKTLPFESPGKRFHVVTSPVTYVCAPLAGGGGTLMRYAGYGIHTAQPNNVAAAPLLAATSQDRLAGYVGAAGGGGCSFSYQQTTNASAQRTGLVTMQLTLTRSGESVTLYNASHVSNEP